MLKVIRVLDFTNYLPGPFATMRLADLGAEIIKVEPPDGDPARQTGMGGSREGVVFQANNRGKKSVILDLKKREDMERAKDLISTADAMIESFRPGVMEKLGLSYQAVKAVNPTIVYCSISGFGQHGSLSQLGSHDLNYMALSGVLAQLKDSSGKPIHPTITLADYFGGFAANERILAGLVSKGMTGKGSYHSISIADIMVSLMGNHVLIQQETGGLNGVPVLNGSVVSYAIYETNDGRYMSLGALEPKFWRNFCEAIGREDWISAQFTSTESTNPVYQNLNRLFKSKTFYEWIEFSQEIDCCMAPVLEVGELAGNPYFKEKKLVFLSSWGTYQVKMHSDLHHDQFQPPPKKGNHSANLF